MGATDGCRYRGEAPELFVQEYTAALCARKALSYSLVDDHMFRQQFSVCIVTGLTPFS